MIRWGIVSTANIGLKRVIPAIQKSHNGEVVAIASRTVERAREAADEAGIPRAYGDYETLLTDEGIDAIYNPLPNHRHRWSIEAAKAGIPTLCEKPLALNADEAQEIVDAFSSRGIPFAEAFMYRFHPRIQRVKKMTDDGVLGDLRTISATFSFPMSSTDNIRLIREYGGGSLMDVGCYCINIMRLMTGEEPAEVTGQGIWGDQSDVDVTFTGTLRFPSGTLGHFDCAFNAAFVAKADIRGAEGRVLLERSFTPNAHEETTIRYWHDYDYEEIHIDAVDQYQLMVEDFADALLDDRPPRFDPQDAVENMRTIDRLYAAAGHAEPFA